MKTNEKDGLPRVGEGRRHFLKQSAAGAAAGIASLTSAFPAIAQGRNVNGRLGIGVIGAGGRSGAHLNALAYLRDQEKYPVELVASCDVYRPRMEEKQKRFKIPKGYTDHRELLADPDIDVVFIATPDHHHGYQAIDAIQAGKDVYCEKPVTHWRQCDLTKRLAEVVAKSDRVFILGTQAMGDSVWHQMKELVRDGFIGQPLYGETGFFRIGDWGERGMKVDDPDAKPGPDLDWDAFQGDAPKHPYSVDRHFRWRLFEDYAGGPSTDLFPHSLTQVIDILGVGFPELVVATGGIHRYDYELREVPDTFNLLAQYPEKVTIAVLGSQANDHNTTERRGSGHRQPTIRGWDGALTISDNREIVFTPVGEGTDKKPQRFPIARAENYPEYVKHFLDCCQARNRETWSPMDLAFRTQTVLQMGMRAMKEQGVARWNGKRQRITT